jgi:uncharacterized phage-associated protein
MAFSSLAVANHFIKKSMGEQSSDLTQMKIQKLVFFAHGWHLAIKDKPLVDEQVEAWDYGPVIPQLYSYLRDYGNQPVVSTIRKMEMDFGGDNPWEITWSDPSLETSQNPQTEIDVAVGVANSVWKKYGIYDAVRLSNMTHLTGTPWELTVSKAKKELGYLPKGTDIPQEVIRDYFRAIMPKANHVA